jgi:hypothetical protein
LFKKTKHTNKLTACQDEAVEFGAIPKLHLGSYATFSQQLPACSDAPKGDAVLLRAWTKPKKGQNETLISPSEAKRFAAHGVSRWNPYGRRISHFAGLFVFSDLTPFSFRRFRALFVFNGLAPFFVSPLSRRVRPASYAESVVAPCHEKCKLG